MANFDTNLYRKGVNQRGLYGGKEQTVTGLLTVADGGSIALADLIRAVNMGENTRPVRIVLTATPVSGTPVLTNATFNVGVVSRSTEPFERPDGTTFTAVATDADALAAAVAIDADNMYTDIEVPRPVANGVQNYAPYTVTLTPAGVGAFSVAGGDIELGITVTFLGEQVADGFVYTTYMDENVNNQT